MTQSTPVQTPTAASAAQTPAQTPVRTPAKTPAGVGNTASSITPATPRTPATPVVPSAVKPTLTPAQDAALKFDKAAWPNFEFNDDGSVTDNRAFYQFGGNPVRLQEDWQAHLAAKGRKAEIDAWKAPVVNSPKSDAAPAKPASSEAKPGIFSRCWSGFTGLLGSTWNAFVWLITGCGCFSSSKADDAASKPASSAAAASKTASPVKSPAKPASNEAAS